MHEGRMNWAASCWSGDDAADNLVLACKTCNSSRGEKGVFEWLRLKEEGKLHRLVVRKYLKQLMYLSADL